MIGSLNNGGSQAMIMNLYRNIDRTKIQFDFIIDREDEIFFADEIKSMGGRIYILPIFKGINFFEFTTSWREFFENHTEYKIIHGHVRSTASIYLSIAKKFGLKTIAHSHNISSGKGFSALVKNVLQFPIRFKVDQLFACSLEAGEWLFGKKAVKSSKFKIIKNAIDSKKYKFDLEKRKIVRDYYQLSDKYIIGHVGRFHNQKNHEFLIDMFNIVSKVRQDAVLMLVGDGELRDSITTKINKLNLEDKVLFTGARNDVHDLMQAMDIFVFPSLFEGLGMVVIEAQASGLRCIVSDNVPNEASITKLVERIPLKQDIWSQVIIGCSEEDRTIDYSEQVRAKGYDIDSNAKEIEDYYFKLYS